MSYNPDRQIASLLLTSTAFISSSRAAAGTLAPGMGTVSATILRVVNAAMTLFFTFCLVLVDKNDEGGELIRFR